MAVPNYLRAPGLFLFCAIQAVIGTAVVESPFYGHSKTVVAVLLKEYIFSTTIPFAIGYLVYHRWKLVQAKWLWVAGPCWFAIGTSLWLRQASVLEGHFAALYAVMSGLGCVSGLASTGCKSWFVYTIPSLRIICYSIGALCCGLVARTSSRPPNETARDLRSEEAA